MATGEIVSVDALEPTPELTRLAELVQGNMESADMGYPGDRIASFGTNMGGCL